MNYNTAFRERGVSIISYFLVVVYSVVSAFTMFMNGDDYVWYYVDSNLSLSGYRNPNGRYLSNFLTIQIVHSSLLRLLFVSVVLVLLVFGIAKLMDIRKCSFKVKLCFSLSALILIPPITYCEVFSWISGFSNYVFPVMLTVLYLLMVFRVLFSEERFKAYHFILFPALGLGAGLCIEHSTIYDIILGSTVIILLKLKRKKIFVAPCLYLAFACVAALFMFTNNNYSDISQSNDIYGNRKFVFESSDFFMNFLRTVINYYTKKYLFINLAIFFSVVVLFFKNNENVKKSKYSIICMIIIIAYIIYSMLCSSYSDLVFLSDAMRMRGLEAAFSFLYLVSLAYFVWVFLDADRRIRAYFYLISTLFLTGPFLFIDPATARCFFANYVFWILFSGELISAVLEKLDFDAIKKFVLISIITSFCSVLFILNIEITNYYFNFLRFDFIKEQIEDGRKSGIQLINYPYSNYILDSFNEQALFITDLNNGVTYFDLMSEYYGFDHEDLEMNSFTYISTSDYFRYISNN